MLVHPFLIRISCLLGLLFQAHEGTQELVLPREGSRSGPGAAVSVVAERLDGCPGLSAADSECSVFFSLETIIKEWKSTLTHPAPSSAFDDSLLCVQKQTGSCRRGRQVAVFFRSSPANGKRAAEELVGNAGCGKDLHQQVHLQNRNEGNTMRSLSRN